MRRIKLTSFGENIEKKLNLEPFSAYFRPKQKQIRSYVYFLKRMEYRKKNISRSCPFKKLQKSSIYASAVNWWGALGWERILWMCDIKENSLHWVNHSNIVAGVSEEPYSQLNPLSGVAVQTRQSA
jgi:hypothetical protein